MRAQLWAGLRALLVLTVLCGVIYPLAVTAAAQVAFGDRASGSLLKRNGAVVGSSLLGQAFTGAGYFQTRPTAAGAAASGASNLGPTNDELLATVAGRVDAYRQANGLPRDATVPVDAVTASGSGLDPHISLANARIQAVQVARVRALPIDAVLRLADRRTSGRSLGFLGEKGVNVLEINLDLDALR